MLKGAALPKYQMSVLGAGFVGGDPDTGRSARTVGKKAKEPVAKITEPFGEHIGGARKELWRGRELGRGDIASMNGMEREKYIKKDNIWKKPDYMDMIRRGRSAEVVYAIKKIRDSIMPAIPHYSADSTDGLRLKRQEEYVAFCSDVRDMAMSLSTEEDLYGIFDNFLIGGGYAVKRGTNVSPTQKSGVFLTRKLFDSLRITRATVCQYRYDVERTGFGTEKYKKGRKASVRRTAYVPEQLQDIEREGLGDVRHGRDITGMDFIEAFRIRGGEVGNWLSIKDAQASLNMAYEALHDFAAALGIQPGQASFGGRLAIAFGARGQGKAAAHYEPMREVINLTKMNGAGSLGHELFHALDDIVGKKLGLGGMMSKNWKKSDVVPYSVLRLFETMFSRYEAGGEREKRAGQECGEIRKAVSDYMSNSMAMDRMYSKDTFGYWSSPCEMFARAGACFLNDRLEWLGGRSDYLCGHSESCVSLYCGRDGNVEIISAVPSGEERKAINSAMEDMITDLRERGLFMTDEERGGIVRDNARARLENGCILEVNGSASVHEGCDACVEYRLYDRGGALKDGGVMGYNTAEYHGNDVAVLVPKVIGFCFGGKGMGYMLMGKRSLFYMAMHGETRYFENTSGLDAEALCGAYAGCGLPFVEMARYGREIGIEEYAGIEQDRSLSFSLKFDAEEDEIVIFDGTGCVRRRLGNLDGRIS